MSENPFVGPTYPLESLPTSVQRTVNMMPVPVEPGNERSSWVFKDVPGLVSVSFVEGIVAEFSDVSDAFTSFTFTDLTVGDPISWAWDFGDGGTSTLQNPSHIYAAGGTYTVTLVAANAAGQSDSVSHDVTAVAAVHDEVLLLMHFDSNASGWVEQRGRTVTTHGTVNAFVPIGINPASKFGAACAGFPGGFPNYLTAPSTALFDFAGDPFVWDVWVSQVPSTGHPNIIFAVAKNGSSLYPVMTLFANSSGGVWTFQFYLSSDQAGNAYESPAVQSITAPVTQDFVHVRCGRINDTTIGISINGATPTTAAIPSGRTYSNAAANTTVIGWAVNNDTSNDAWTGSMDELCCRAVAMDSTSFTPPAVRFEYP